ncbi:MAG: hypothetical protein EOO01_28170, partial [Chitinophagaceae bacterium]
MNTLVLPRNNELVGYPGYFPAVSIISPFDPKMTPRREITARFNAALDKVATVLKDNYPSDASVLIMERLRAAVASLNFNTHKKSVSICISPVFEKVIYLEIPVVEKITVGSGFDIRELVFHKKQSPQYLLLVFGSKKNRIYRGDGSKLTRILSDRPGSAFVIPDETQPQLDAFRMLNVQDEMLTDKNLHRLDNSLGILINTYHLPVFFLGPEKVFNQFQLLSRHTDALIGCEAGNYEDKSIPGLMDALQPFLLQWNEHRQKHFARLLRHADSGILTTGMRNVWRQARNAKGRVLL